MAPTRTWCAEREMKTVKAIVFSVEGMGFKPKDENCEEFELQQISYTGQNIEKEGELRVAHIIRPDKSLSEEEATRKAVRNVEDLVADQELFDYAIVFACFAEHHRKGAMELLRLIEASGAKKVVAVRCRTASEDEISACAWFQTKALSNYSARRHLRDIVIDDHDFECRSNMEWAINRFLEGEI